ncbi:MAG: glycosyltransferase family 39 protein [Thermoanaerobaculia bacterium]
MRPAGDRAALRLLVAAFLLRALFLDLALPYGDPLDEWFHFAYAQFVSQEGHLPGPVEPSIAKEFERPGALLPRSTLFVGMKTTWRELAALPDTERVARRRFSYRYVPGDRRTYLFANYETQQPPLFYLLAAGPLALLPESPLDVRLLVVRVLASILAAAAIVLAYLFFRTLFARRPALAVTAALVAFPALGSFVGRFTNDALAVPIIAAMLPFFVRASEGRLTRRRAVILSLLLAAGLWTKLYVLTLLPAAPIAALLAPRPRRRAAVARSLMAAGAALVVFVPWMLRQHALSGDWLGLTPTKEAVLLRLGPMQAVAAAPSLLRLELFGTFARTFLYPGTWSVMGASSAGAAALAAGLLLLAAIPALGRTPATARRRRRWAVGGVAVALFLIGHAAHAAAFAAIARARGEPIGFGGEGWYVLVLLPVFVAAAAAFGKSVGPRAAALSAALFLSGEAWMTFGALPAVYAGAAEPGRVSAATVVTFLMHPRWSLGTFARTGLAGAPAWLLGAIATFWLACLGAAIGLLLRRLSAAAVASRPAAENF